MTPSRNKGWSSTTATRIVLSIDPSRYHRQACGEVSAPMRMTAHRHPPADALNSAAQAYEAQPHVLMGRMTFRHPRPLVGDLDTDNRVVRPGGDELTLAPSVPERVREPLLNEPAEAKF